MAQECLQAPFWRKNKLLMKLPHESALIWEDGPQAFLLIGRVYQLNTWAVISRKHLLKEAFVEVWHFIALTVCKELPVHPLVWFSQPSFQRGDWGSVRLHGLSRKWENGRNSPLLVEGSCWQMHSCVFRDSLSSPWSRAGGDWHGGNSSGKEDSWGEMNPLALWLHPSPTQPPTPQLAP